MASTNKTINLGLNNWLETDSPKRADFVSDNIIIDNLVGNHIKDGSLHLTADEKDRVGQPFDINTYYGTGDTFTTIKLNYIPRLAIICEKNSPYQTAGNGNIIVHSAIISDIGSTGGAEISENYVLAYQSTEATNGVVYNLNKSGSEYMLITFR